jgi:hypothetical protein
MDLNKRQALVQEEFGALDMAVAEARELGEEVDRTKTGFGNDDK